ARGAGTVTSNISAFSGVACLVTLTWLNATPAKASIRKAFMCPRLSAICLVDHSSKQQYARKVNSLSMPKPPGTRDRLIKSARYLFWERGFAGTSMADLLSHANVNSGSFYHFFESKEALLRAVLESYLGALRPMVVDPAFATVDEPLARIFAILAGYRERI